MSIAVNYTYPFNIPEGPDLHETYFVGQTVAVSWALPSNVSISLEYTNDTDEDYQYSSHIWTFLNNQTNQNFAFWQLDPLFIQPAQEGRLRLYWYPGGPGYGDERPRFALSPKFRVDRRQSTSAEVGVGIVVPVGVVLIIAALWWAYVKRTPWGIRGRMSREVVR